MLSLIVVALVGACSGGPNQTGGQSGLPPIAPSAAPTTAPTIAPATATPGILELASEGTMFPGTYRTQFEPPMTLTINDLVDLDCAPGYRCRGDIDVNIEHWVGLEFGNTHGSELDVTRVDKVPATPGGTTLMDPPDDLATWVAGQPGIERVSEPLPVTIGGVPGVRLDIRTDKAVSFGPSWGTCPGCRSWITVLRAHDAWVLIIEQLGPDNTVRDFDAVVRGLQPVVDSIIWN
jgi:hypothetical protein